MSLPPNLQNLTRNHAALNVRFLIAHRILGLPSFLTAIQRSTIRACRSGLARTKLRRLGLQQNRIAKRRRRRIIPTRLTRRVRM